MIKVCGENTQYQLGEQSNNVDSFNSNPVINPMLDFKYDVSSLLSISFYFKQTVWITRERRAFCIGDNSKFQIIDNLPQETIQSEREIIIKNKDGRQAKFISVVCGETYTLYRVSFHSDLKHSQLVYQYQDHPQSIFLNLNGREPIALYGGDTVSAVIDSEGAIIVFTNSILNSPEKVIPPNFLPNSEKAVFVACLNNRILVLSHNSHVYESAIDDVNGINFTPVNELFDKEVNRLSGTYEHCFAVCKNSTVYGRGSNKFGQLALGKSVEKVDVFTEISSLSEYEIKYVSAGVSHSLFQTTDGKVLACGNNFIGQLPLSQGLKKHQTHSPSETVINSGATFCVAGAGETAIFTDSPPPLNTPNMKVTKDHRRQSKVKGKSKSKSSSKKEDDDEKSPQKADSKSLYDSKSFNDSKSEEDSKSLYDSKGLNDSKSEGSSKHVVIQTQPVEPPKKEEDEVQEEEEVKDTIEPEKTASKDIEDDDDVEQKSESGSKSEDEHKNDDEVEKLKKELAEQKEELEKAVQAQKEAMALVATKDAMLTATQREAASLVVQKDAMVTTQRENEKLIEALRQANRELKDEKGELEDENEKLKDANRELKDEKEELKDSKEELEEEIEKLKDANRELKDEKEEMSDENDKLKEANGELKDAKEELNDENDKLKQANRELKDAKEELKDENGELKEENEKLKEENEELKRKIKSLQETINSASKETATKNSSSGSTAASSASSSEGNVEILDSETIRSLRSVEEIGSSGSGKIVKVVKEEKFALKVMNPSEHSTRNQKQFIQQQMKLNSQRHPNIVRTYGIHFEDSKSSPSILLELCDHDLQTAVKSGNLSNEDIVKYIYQIVEGMKYAHSLDLVHRDLKPTNILISKDGTVKITEFGIPSLMTTEEQSKILSAASQKFMAPEILNEEKYDEKTDVYSFGVILYFLLSNGEMPKITIIQMGNGKKAPIPDSFTDFAGNLINRCWETDPDDRPSFSRILELLDKKDYGVLELSSNEVDDIRQFISEHKKKIPQY